MVDFPGYCPTEEKCLNQDHTLFLGAASNQWLVKCNVGTESWFPYPNLGWLCWAEIYITLVSSSALIVWPKFLLGPVFFPSLPTGVEPEHLAQ
jgi:hypothetical protein